MPHKEFDLASHRKPIMKKINEQLGEPVNPSWKEQFAYWKKRIETFVPRGFMYVFDIDKERTILSYGLSSIGYMDNKELTAFDILGLVHENHRLLLSYQVYRIHEVMLELKYKDIGFDYYSAGARAIKDVDGNYWLTYYTSEPFQFDVSGTQVRHLTWFHILSPYKGEPLYLDFFHKDGKKNHAPLSRMQDALDDIREKQLQYLGFTDRHLEIIKHHQVLTPPNEIARLLRISKRTLEGHNRSILRIGKECFPKTKFNNYKDVVAYLTKQDLTP